MDGSNFHRTPISEYLGLISRLIYFTWVSGFLRYSSAFPHVSGLCGFSPHGFRSWCTTGLSSCLVLSPSLWCLPSGLHRDSWLPGSLPQHLGEPESVPSLRASIPATFPGKYTPVPSPLEGVLSLCSRLSLYIFALLNSSFEESKGYPIQCAGLWHPSSYEP